MTILIKPNIRSLRGLTKAIVGPMQCIDVHFFTCLDENTLMLVLETSWVIIRSHYYVIMTPVNENNLLRIGSQYHAVYSKEIWTFLSFPIY